MTESGYCTALERHGLPYGSAGSNPARSAYGNMTESGYCDGLENRCLPSGSGGSNPPVAVYSTGTRYLEVTNNTE